MPYIKVGEENSGSIELYYEDHGTGQPIVLIHGWPLSGRSWEKQVTALLAAGQRVITYDRRGFGFSSKPAFGYDYNTFADDLDKVMTTLDLQDAVLVGFSMGTGEVARYLANYGSNRVSKAVFIASVPPFLLKTDDNPEGVERSVFEDIMQKINADRPAYLSEFLTNFYNTDTFLGNRLSDEVVRLSWNVAASASPIGTLDCVKAWLTDFRDDLTRIDIPCLVIHGDADRILPIDSTGSRLKEALEGSRYLLVEGAPHGLIWTHADKINPEIINFIQSGEPRRRPLAGKEARREPRQTLQ